MPAVFAVSHEYSAGISSAAESSFFTDKKDGSWQVCLNFPLADEYRECVENRVQSFSLVKI
jgi:hypothetical protein